MRQITKILAGFWLVMLILAGIAAVTLANSITKQDKSYLVTINRIEAQMEAGKTEEELKEEVSKQKDSLVKALSFLRRGAGEVEKQVFFEGVGVKENCSYTIRALPAFLLQYEYIRYEYEQERPSLAKLMAVAAGIFLTMMLFVTGLLFYVQYAILYPFHKIQEMPYELAKGNYSYDMKESRFRYFGRFLWGLDRLKEELKQAKEKQLALEKEKKLMILTASHDIKTPLSSIYLYTRALSSNLYKTEEKRQEIYQQIQDKVHQIEQFVGQIEQMSTTDLLEITVHKKEHYISEFIEPLRKAYQEKFALKMTRVEIEDYEDKLVYADLDRVGQVFANLFENAMKYGDGRWVRVSFTEEEYCQLIKVTSSGGVIDSRQFPHMFESFWRGENAEGKKGSGLGLYICKEIMTRLDGDIFAEAEEDGMSFTLVFPMYS